MFEDVMLMMMVSVKPCKQHGNSQFCKSKQIN